RSGSASGSRTEPASMLAATQEALALGKMVLNCCVERHSDILNSESKWLAISAVIRVRIRGIFPAGVSFPRQPFAGGYFRRPLFARVMFTDTAPKRTARCLYG